MVGDSLGSNWVFVRLIWGYVDDTTYVCCPVRVSGEFGSGWVGAGDRSWFDCGLSLGYGWAWVEGGLS